MICGNTRSAPMSGPGRTDRTCATRIASSARWVSWLQATFPKSEREAPVGWMPQEISGFLPGAELTLLTTCGCISPEEAPNFFEPLGQHFLPASGLWRPLNCNPEIVKQLRQRIYFDS